MALSSQRHYPANANRRDDMKQSNEPIIRLGSRPSEVLMAKVTVSNLRKSFDFYTQIVGLREAEADNVPKAVFDDDDVAFTELALNCSGSFAHPFLCLIKQKGALPDPQHARLTWVGVKTTDTRGALERARAAGVPIEIEATAVAGMVFGLIRDPDGYTVQLIEAQSLEQ